RLGAGGDDQPVALGAVARHGALGGAVQVDAEREEAQPARLLAEALQEELERLFVGRVDRADVGGAAVAQRDVDVGRDGGAHSAWSSGPAPKRAGSLAGSRVSWLACSIACRASSSPRPRVLRASAITFAGRTQPAAAS